MRNLNILLITLFISNFSYSQNNYEKFVKFFDQKDTTKVKELLAVWEKESPNDPEFYTSAFNYYFSKSKEDVISLQTEEPKSESLILKDSSGKIAGYLTSLNSYNYENFNKALHYANIGIEKFPNRLDIRFGKCFVLGKAEDYSNFTKEIVKTINFSLINKNKWLWTKNEIKEDAEKFMLGSIQAYLVQLYNTENDDLLKNMIEIGDLVIKNYPNNVEILSTTSVAYMLMKEYDKAIEILKIAEKLNPKDYIVLSNIGQGYFRKGDKVNAKKYYELALKYGDDYTKEQAKNFLEKLK